MKSLNIAILMGGISNERNVSLTGGKYIFNALISRGHNVIALDPALGKDAKFDPNSKEIPINWVTNEELAQYPTRNIIECVNSDLLDNIDVVFLFLHGTNGEDGKVQALLELRGIPYTGSGVMASSLAMDKVRSKMMMLSAGINTAAWTLVRKEDYQDMEYLKNAKAELGKRLVIKPNSQGSTIGLTVLKNASDDEIYDAVQLAGKYDDGVVIEQYIDGTEITVAIFDGEALPIIEIKPKVGMYDYENKYTKGNTEYICPAELSEDITEFVQNMSLTLHETIGCKGFSRVDFILNHDNEAFCLEINTIPGFTSTSLVPMAGKAAGYSFEDLCERLVQIALGDEEEEEVEDL